MIKRIVKLTFKLEKVDAFQQIFEESKDKIRYFEGCQHLELWQSVDDKRIFFTYSFWQEEEYLENYRASELFKKVWAKTKILFDDRPEAWSVKMKEKLC